MKEGELDAFIGENGHFSTIFDFSAHILSEGEHGWYDAPPVDFKEWRKAITDSQLRVQKCGLEANIIENHDEPRGVSHYIPEADVSDTSKKMLAAVNVMLRGLPFIYQGQELGMTNVAFHSIIDDCSTLDEYQVALDAGLTPESAFKAVVPYSRDNARTPFQWDATANAGFTTGTPWLKVNPNYSDINAAEQANRPDSMYHWYKELIALRKNSEYKDVVVYGEVVPYKEEQTNLMAYYRKGTDRTLLVIANYQHDAQDVVLPGTYKKVLMNNLETLDLNGDILHMPGYQVVIFEM